MKKNKQKALLQFKKSKNKINQVMMNEPKTMAYVYGAADLYEQAMEAYDEGEKIVLLEKALKLAPDDLDILSELILQLYSPLEAYEQLCRIEKETYHKNKKTIMDGYGYLDNRPYFRLKHRLIQLAIEIGAFRQAIEHSEESLVRNESDNLGVRYELMGVYAIVHDLINAEKLFNSNVNYKHDDRMLVPLVANYIIHENFEKASLYIKILCDENPNILDFLAHGRLEFLGIPWFNSYMRNSRESAYLSFFGIRPLLMISEYVVDMFYQLVKTLNTDYFENIEEKKEKILQARLMSYSLAGKGIFKNIKSQYVYSLLLNDLEKKSDFKKVTIEEVLKLDNIGKKTIDRLIENGVVFKK